MRARLKRFSPLFFFTIFVIFEDNRVDEYSWRRGRGDRGRRGEGNRGRDSNVIFIDDAETFRRLLRGKKIIAKKDNEEIMGVFQRNQL